ncbi:MAG: hypothetical protein JWR35_62 [Marmoricola sp.]|nr:hypothetical protein [Marmoricola sp.]
MDTIADQLRAVLLATEQALPGYQFDKLWALNEEGATEAAFEGLCTQLAAYEIRPTQGTVAGLVAIGEALGKPVQ